MRSSVSDSTIVRASLAGIYLALLVLALVGVGQYARYGSPLAYVVLGLCATGVVIHAAIAIRALSFRIAALNALGVLALLALTLAALTNVTGDSL